MDGRKLSDGMLFAMGDTVPMDLLYILYPANTRLRADNSRFYNSCPPAQIEVTSIVCTEMYIVYQNRPLQLAARLALLSRMHVLKEERKDCDWDQTSKEELPLICSQKA